MPTHHITNQEFLYHFSRRLGIRIEFEFEQDDMQFQSWLGRGCPSIIEEEPKIDQFAPMYNLSERVEVAWLRDIDLSD